MCTCTRRVTGPPPGIERWTDGKHWSASRSKENFLFYEENSLGSEDPDAQQPNTEPGSSPDSDEPNVAVIDYITSSDAPGRLTKMTFFSWVKLPNDPPDLMRKWLLVSYWQMPHVKTLAKAYELEILLDHDIPRGMFFTSRAARNKQQDLPAAGTAYDVVLRRPTDLDALRWRKQQYYASGRPGPLPVGPGTRPDDVPGIYAGGGPWLPGGQPQSPSVTDARFRYHDQHQRTFPHHQTWRDELEDIPITERPPHWRPNAGGAQGGGSNALLTPGSDHASPLTFAHRQLPFNPPSSSARVTLPCPPQLLSIPYYTRCAPPPPHPPHPPTQRTNPARDTSLSSHSPASQQANAAFRPSTSIVPVQLSCQEEVWLTNNTLVANYCAPCRHNFNRACDLRRHVETIHVKGERGFPCTWPGCTQILNRKDVLQRHVRRQHEGKQKKGKGLQPRGVTVKGQMKLPSFREVVLRADRARARMDVGFALGIVARIYRELDPNRPHRTYKVQRLASESPANRLLVPPSGRADLLFAFFVRTNSSDPRNNRAPGSLPRPPPALPSAAPVEKEAREKSSIADLVALARVLGPRPALPMPAPTLKPRPYPNPEPRRTGEKWRIGCLLSVSDMAAFSSASWLPRELAFGFAFQNGFTLPSNADMETGPSSQTLTDDGSLSSRASTPLTSLPSSPSSQAALGPEDEGGTELEGIFAKPIPTSVDRSNAVLQQYFYVTLLPWRVAVCIVCHLAIEPKQAYRHYAEHLCRSRRPFRDKIALDAAMTELALQDAQLEIAPLVYARSGAIYASIMRMRPHPGKALSPACLVLCKPNIVLAGVISLATTLSRLHVQSDQLCSLYDGHPQENGPAQDPACELDLKVLHALAEVQYSKPDEWLRPLSKIANGQFEQSRERAASYICQLLLSAIRLRSDPERHPHLDLLLNDRQNELVGNLTAILRSIEPVNEPAAREAVKELLHSIITTRAHNTGLASYAVERWLILLSLRPDGSWRTVEAIGPIIGYLMHVVRDLLALHIFLEAGTSRGRQLDICTQIRPCHTDGEPYAWHCLSTLGGLINSIASNNPAWPNAIWSDGGKSIWYSEVTLSLEALRAGIVNIVSATERDFEALAHAKQDIGYSFLTDPANVNMLQARVHLGLINDLIELDMSRVRRAPPLIRLGELEADARSGCAGWACASPGRDWAGSEIASERKGEGTPRFRPRPSHSSTEPTCSSSARRMARRWTRTIGVAHPASCASSGKPEGRWCSSTPSTLATASIKHSATSSLAQPAPGYGRPRLPLLQRAVFDGRSDAAGRGGGELLPFGQLAGPGLPGAAGAAGVDFWPYEPPVPPPLATEGALPDGSDAQLLFAHLISRTLLTPSSPASPSPSTLRLCASSAASSSRLAYLHMNDADPPEPQRRLHNHVHISAPFILPSALHFKQTPALRSSLRSAAQHASQQTIIEHGGTLEVTVQLHEPVTRFLWDVDTRERNREHRVIVPVRTFVRDNNFWLPLPGTTLVLDGTGKSGVGEGEKGDAGEKQKRKELGEAPARARRCGRGGDVPARPSHPGPCGRGTVPLPNGRAMEPVGRLAGRTWVFVTGLPGSNATGNARGHRQGAGGRGAGGAGPVHEH
ncbi:hypothetical protein DACRYDRAFT_99857 [Dacryopinax primogenitus]|uniref:C2H2-type domain-containing protein n=1 Tax=Dacryopinax primogenitus (strain DJM 731) TaxID=1858805 RepID=M5GE28_DACPD|nr:uncharacterized protein DACRYDRAFT_99857 [Dacryopinax primogenitus]EJU02923.1 hypothetical protein DACRYDRAFT_99857 [Dacryopinax primogenitus]